MMAARSPSVIERGIDLGWWLWWRSEPDEAVERLDKEIRVERRGVGRTGAASPAAAAADGSRRNSTDPRLSLLRGAECRRRGGRDRG